MQQHSINLSLCPACDSQPSGQYRDGCRACDIRYLARGSLFFESMRNGSPTPEYKAALRKLGKPSAVHAEVEAYRDQR